PVIPKSVKWWPICAICRYRHDTGGALFSALPKGAKGTGDGGRRFPPQRQRRAGKDLKKVYIKTYGCQMNVYDSERMSDALAPSGYVLVDNAESADLVLLNTCHIREKAAEKVYSELGRLRVLKEEAARAGRQMLV